MVLYLDNLRFESDWRPGGRKYLLSGYIVGVLMHRIKYDSWEVMKI